MAMKQGGGNSRVQDLANPLSISVHDEANEKAARASVEMDNEACSSTSSYSWNGPIKEPV